MAIGRFLAWRPDRAWVSRILRPVARILVRVRVDVVSWVHSPRARIALFSFGVVALGALGQTALAYRPASPDTFLLEAEPKRRDVGEAGPRREHKEAVVEEVAKTPISLPDAAGRAATAVAPTANRCVPRARATPEEPVFLNEASPEELRRLPGVGPKRAEAIALLRARLGRIERLEQLLKVRGLGRGTLRRWRPLVRLEARPASPAGSDDAGLP